MKRFLVFTYDSYYPCGGWQDFKASFDTLAEAIAFTDNYDNKDVIDGQTGEEVA